jgi:DNA-binding MarR family transcriptional regulator
MTRLVGALEQSGLVSRSTDPADTRATLVDATDEGLAHLRAWRAEMRDTLAPRFTDLDEDEWAVLRRAAGILAAHAQEPTTTGEPA